MTRYICFLIIVLLVAGCASNNAIEFSEWGPIGYEGFIEKIAMAEDEGTINCGFHNLIKIEGNPRAKEGLRCVKNSIKEGKPFKFGTLRLPVDSYAYEVLLGKEDGTYVEAVFDIMIDGDAPQQWVKTCKNMSLHWKLDGYSLSGCSPINNDNWP